MSYKNSAKHGFTFIEAVVGVAVFMIVSLSVYDVYAILLKTARMSRLRVAATMIANERLEVVRNLPYASVGTVGGIPSGTLSATSSVERDGAVFSVTTTIRNVDDPFDGILGGTPNDTSPADYKKAEVSVTCAGCFPVSLTTNISPESLEASTDNGALFVNVFDALGQPVSDAVIAIVNSAVTPAVNISDISGVSGSLQLVDVSPSNQNYAITVDKDGYSSDRTYAIGLPENPNPTKPHATVASNEVTRISFSIDKLSSLNVTTATANCTSTPNVHFYVQGAKIIGSNPTVYKYSSSFQTGSSGSLNIPSLEWDTYTVGVSTTTESIYFMAGSLPMSPLSLLPDTTQDIILVTKEKDPNGLLVSVKDIGTHLPVTGASVSLGGAGTLVTGRGYQMQSDWSGGSGQEDFYDDTKYYSSSAVDIDSPAGEIRLANVLDEYEPSGYLESSTFDTGTSGNLYNISWSPIDQPSAAGENSVRFQIASNNGGSAWNYVGPDGTSGTYYTSSGEEIGEAHSGNRYFRYKAYLRTETATATPNVSEVSFSFTSACVPSGQVFFDGLSGDTADMTVTKDGYVTFSEEGVSVSRPWQEKVVYMTPVE